MQTVYMMASVCCGAFDLLYALRLLFAANRHTPKPLYTVCLSRQTESIPVQHDSTVLDAMSRMFYQNEADYKL